MKQIKLGDLPKSELRMIEVCGHLAGPLEELRLDADYKQAEIDLLKNLHVRNNWIDGLVPTTGC